MRISFVILGTPQGKGRPRFTRFGRAYTPPKTKFYEETVRANYKRLIQHKFWEHLLNNDIYHFVYMYSCI